MFVLELNYHTSLLIHLAVFGSLVSLSLGYTIYAMLYNYIHDYNDGETVKIRTSFAKFFCKDCYFILDVCDHYEEVDDVPAPIFEHLFLALWLLIISLVHPIFWPTMIFIWTAKGLRKWVRFKRDINSTLESKADLSHIHKEVA